MNSLISILSVESASECNTFGLSVNVSALVNQSSSDSGHTTVATDGRRYAIDVIGGSVGLSIMAIIIVVAIASAVVYKKR